MQFPNQKHLIIHMLYVDFRRSEFSCRSLREISRRNMIYGIFSQAITKKERFKIQPLWIFHNKRKSHYPHYLFQILFMDKTLELSYICIFFQLESDSLLAID